MNHTLQAIKRHADIQRRSLSFSCLRSARRTPPIQRPPAAAALAPSPPSLAPLSALEPIPVPNREPSTAVASPDNSLALEETTQVTSGPLTGAVLAPNKSKPDRPERPHRPPVIPVPHNPELDLHHLVTTPQRAPQQSHLNAAQFFFRSFPPKLVHSLHRFSRDSKIPSLGNYPEVAFLGPSNAGKSSLLNAMTIKPKGTTSSKAARTSQRPGSTQTVNFYNVGDRLTLVDMMGYGVGSRKEWGAAIEGYLSNRIELKHVFWLLPAHPSHPDEFDLAIRALLLNLNVPHTVVLTQIDRIPSTNAFLRVLDNVHRQIVDPMGGFCSSVVPTASVDKFVPRWDPARMGTGAMAKEIQRAVVDPGLANSPLLPLGWVTIALDQAKVPVKVTRPAQSSAMTRERGGPTLTLSRPGVAHVQLQVLKAAGQDVEKWRSKMKRAGVGVKRG